MDGKKKMKAKRASRELHGAGFSTFISRHPEVGYKEAGSFRATEGEMN
jgi:hypothetical protein